MQSLRRTGQGLKPPGRIRDRGSLLRQAEEERAGDCRERNPQALVDGYAHRNLVADISVAQATTQSGSYGVQLDATGPARLAFVPSTLQTPPLTMKCSDGGLEADRLAMISAPTPNA